MVGLNQRHHLHLQHLNIPQEVIIPRNKLQCLKNEQGPSLNPPQQNSTITKHLSVLSIIKYFVEVYIRRKIYFTLLNFAMKKVLQNFAMKELCYKTVASSIVIRNGNVSSYISVSVHHTLRNFKKFFFGKWYIADY